MYPNHSYNSELNKLKMEIVHLKSEVLSAANRIHELSNGRDGHKIELQKLIDEREVLKLDLAKKDELIQKLIDSQDDENSDWA